MRFLCTINNNRALSATSSFIAAKKVSETKTLEPTVLDIKLLVWGQFSWYTVTLPASTGTTMVGVDSSRRRRKSDGKSILPMTAKNASKYSNSKRKRRKQFNRLIPLVVGATLVLAAVFTIASNLTKNPATSTSWWNRSLGQTSKHGCHNANIHSIVDQEPNPPAICINDPHLMPTDWRAPEDVVFADPGGPWTSEEQTLADEAVNRGLDELVSFLESAKPSRIQRLGVDAVNSVFDYVLGSQEMPEFHQKAVDTSIKVLKISVQKHMNKDEKSEPECDKMYARTTLTAFAHRLSMESPKDLELKGILDSLVDHLNKSIEVCESLDLMFSDGVNEEDSWREDMKDKELHVDDINSWIMWAVALTDCLTIPELALPEDAQDFVASTWEYFADYDIASNKEYEHEEEVDERGPFVKMANLATHVQCISTGCGRHYSYVKDAPYLYHYYRENFYAAMNQGGHEVVADFIYNLMNYGCSPENDIHVRHGFRFMLHMYTEADHSFVNNLEEWEHKEDLSDYERIHKPWTGIAAVETKRCFEPELPGSYGHAFRKALTVASSSSQA